MSNLETERVKRVSQALIDAGLPDTVRELPDSTKSIAEAASALGVEQGAIVKTLVYTVGNRYVLVLVAGDHHCGEDQLGRALNLDGGVVRPSADLVRAVTGFAPTGPCGGVSPVGGVSKLPVAIDASLKRFDTVFAAAGHSHCVFATSIDDLKQLTKGVVSYAIAKDAKEEPKP